MLVGIVMLGRVIRSPEIWKKEEDDRKGIFLAGGITDCPQWQLPTATKLADSLNAIIVDPRRDKWSMQDNHVHGVVQIQWEAKHLKKCDVILFWFPKESLCPITLFELGVHLGRDVKLYIGTDRDYSRRLDVEVQVALVKPEMKIWCDLDKMIDAIIKEWTS